MPKTYQDFWQELSSAYPVSQGKLRLPIATSILTIEEIDMKATLLELQRVLQTFIDTFANRTKAMANAKAAGEERIFPCINDDFSGVVRFDCVLDAHNAVKILELNTDYPDGLLMHDRTYSILSDSHCQLHEQLYLKYFGDTSKTIHIAHHKDAYFLDAYYLEKAVLESHGYTVTIGKITDCSEVGLTRRCVEVSKINEVDIEHIQKSSERELNTFSLRTLGYKNLLTEVSHPYIPRTIPCNNNTAEEIIAHKDSWLIKPTQGCEGNGIYFGKDLSTTDWEEKVRAAVTTNYIAQEYVQIKQRMVTFYDADATKTKTLFFDFCPHFFIAKGEIIGVGHILIRFSENPIINVAQGGGLGYHQIS